MQPAFASARLRRCHPGLSAAHAEAKRRFLKLPGVRGIGIGRKFIDKRGRYAKDTDRHGGFCVKIYVERKLTARHLPIASHRIPRFLVVKIGRGKRRVRVPLDIVQVGKPVLAEAWLAKWPGPIGMMDVGRLFLFGRPNADMPTGTYPDQPGFAELGTLGAAIRMKPDGSVRGVSAGHVFADTCALNTDYSAPGGKLTFGANVRDWVLSVDPPFKPQSMLSNRLITDAMLFPIPGALLRPDFTWPPLFDSGSLASANDTDGAILNKGIRGFVWVDRAQAAPVKIHFDLRSCIDNFCTNPCGQGEALNYVKLWKYSFATDAAHSAIGYANQTAAGDSGSGVFVETDDGTGCRLLGFHFMHNTVEQFGLAIDAAAFFAAQLDSFLGSKFVFA
jgi:hypothetical protein